MDTGMAQPLSPRRCPPEAFEVANAVQNGKRVLGDRAGAEIVLDCAGKAPTATALSTRRHRFNWLAGSGAQPGIPGCGICSTALNDNGPRLSSVSGEKPEATGRAWAR
jgi:hypothetical protein